MLSFCGERLASPYIMEVVIRFPILKLGTRSLLLLLFLQLLAYCGTQGSEERTIEVRFQEISVESTAVSMIMPLVTPSHQPDEANLSSSHQSLFTYLAQTDPADLVRTKPHSQGTWRIEKIFLLDDCVAVQMTEGHFLETIFFVQHSKGWRLTTRIRPQDHEWQ